MDPGARPAPVVHDARTLILCFTAGVLLVHTLPELPPAAGLCAAAAAALFPWRLRPLLLALVLGVSFTTWRALPVLEQRWPAARHGEDLWVTGTIASLPERGTEAQRFLFEPAGGAVPPRIRASWYRASQAVKAGECWRFELRLRTPHGSLNPGGFDYEGWLFQQGIGATATVRAAERCAAPEGYRVLRWRQALVDRVQEWLPGHPALGFIAALSVGDRSAFRDSDWDLFRLTGTSHLVAISGFNIAIAAGVAFFLFRWLWAAWPRLCLWLPAQRVGLLGSALAAFAYAVLAGFEPPVQRAVVMLLVLLVAAWMHRLAEASRVLALAWLFVLLLDPFAVLSPGLWLSFGAVAAIYYVSTARLRTPGWLHAALFLQLMLAVALAPLTLFFFQGASWIAPLVNLLAVPAFVVLTPAVLAGISLAALAPGAGVPLLRFVADLLELFHRGLALAAQAPELWLPAAPPLPALLLAALGVALLFAPRGLPLRPLALLCLVPLFVPPRTAPESGFTLAALDVGQGLAVVVRTAQHTLLYDAGPAFEDGFDAGESVVAPYLLKQGLHGIDLLFLSHDDNDHAGGVPAVRKLLRVEREIGTRADAPCRAGLSWEWDGVRFETLHPGEGHWSENNTSCVLRIESPVLTALLPGDIEAAAEKRLVRDRAPALKADVLLAPHHGSKTSSTEEFVQAVRPQVVVHSAGWRSHFGHPRPEVVARYAGLDARQFITGNLGAVEITVGEGGPQVKAWRPKARRFWNAEPE